MKYDTLIINGEVVTETGIVAMDVAINDGKIAALLARNSGATAEEVIDATDS